MSEWIRIRVKDFYKDAVGELEYTYVTREVYEALADTFRKEAHAQEMRDIRHTTKDGYTEGETEDLVELTGESVEDTVIRQMEIATLQKAMQSHTPVQRERLHFYFFEGMTYRQIAAKEGVGEKNIRESINGAVKKIKKYNYIRFATREEIDTNMPLTITPEPDTTIRVLMEYKGLENPIEVEEQKLEKIERNGFIAVEWGGTEIK